MNTQPTLARPHAFSTVVAAAVSSCIAIGIFSGVVGLFGREGTPYQQVVTAEHACTQYDFVSEREACVRLMLAAPIVPNLASR